MAGFEPTHDGVKVRCLTAWRHPNDMTLYIIKKSKKIMQKKRKKHFKCRNCFFTATFNTKQQKYFTKKEGGIIV